MFAFGGKADIAQIACYKIAVPGALFWFAPLQRNRTRSPSPKGWGFCLCTSAFGGKPDMTFCGCLLSWSRLGLKRTCPFAAHMSAFDPKRTLLTDRR
jgi:hypothetical protein